MGYGLGIDAEARQGAVFSAALGARSGWTLQSPLLPGVFGRVTVVTPAGTPPLIELATLTSEARRGAHAAALVTPLPAMPSGEIVTRRTVLGDARDLFIHGLRRRLGGALPALSAPEEGDTLPWNDATTLFVHIGPTTRALSLLRDVVDPAAAHRWNGTPETLDADGFVWLAARSTASVTHLLILGGSDYGTHFGVAAFLERYLDAAWLFPGALGEVIPAATELRLMPAPDRIEEPAVRSRTHALMVSSNAHSAAECDDVRAWALRNRLRPHNERALILLQARAGDLSPTACAPRAIDRTFLAAMLETEERIPAGGHTLSRYLSPHVGVVQFRG